MTFSSRIGVVLIGVATQSCLAWVLGPAARGSYAVCLLFATLLGICVVVGYDLPSLYFVASKRFTVSEGVAHAVAYGGIGSALAVAVGLAMMQMPLPFLQKASPQAFYLSLAFVPIALYAYTFLQLLTSVRDFRWFALLQLASAAALLLFTLVFVWGLSWGPEGGMLANIGAGVVTMVGVLLVLRRKHGLTRARPSLEGLKAMLRYGARYYVGKISNLVNFQMGTIVLAFFATREEVGLFAVAASLTARTLMIPDALSRVLIPRVAGDRAGTGNMVALCARLTLLICGGLLVILSIFARPIVSLLFSPAFLPVVPLIWILAVGMLVRGPAKVFTAYLLGADHPGTASLATAAGMAVNAAALWILLPILRLRGAAAGLTASYLVGAGIVVVFFSRFSGLGLRQVFRFRRSDWAPLLAPFQRGRAKADPGGGPPQ